MRILAIRGAGLASLEKEFELDFTAEPLAGTGLFAITGETGAGKSTILDAMCLALYGRYPRVDVSLAETVPDPSGRALTAKDARMILRRGTAQGFAEVDFVGQDGVACRVRWAAARARGKATGRLQNVQRLISRLDDGAALAEGLSAVEAEVERRTGLTFEQFRRTVLLAQGEFDAFLLSAEGARAELLEKITGTEIYARISIAVYEGAKQRQEAVARLKERQEQVGLMDPEVREALAAQEASVRAGIAAKASEAEAVARRIAHARAIEGAQARYTQSAAALTLAETAWMQAAQDRAQLDGLQAVAPLRAPAAAVQRASERVAAARQEDRDANDEAVRSENEAAAAQATLDRMSAVRGAAERAVEGAEPVWRQAEALDVAVSAAGDELAAASEQARAATLRCEASEARRAELADALAGVRASVSADSAALALRVLHAPLADRAGEVASLLARASELRGGLARARTVEGRARAEAERAARSLAEAGATIRAERQRRADLQEAIAARTGALAAIDEAQVRSTEARLVVLSGLVAQVGPLVQRREEIGTARVSAMAMRDSGTKAAREARERIDALERERETLGASRREMQGLVDLADTVMRPEAIALRSALVTGHPCPVCGGSEHPFARPDHPEAVLVERVRQRREALDAEIAKVARGVQEAQREAVEAQAQATHAATVIGDADRDIAAADVALAELVPKVTTAAAAAGLSFAQAGAGEASTALIAALAQDAEAARREIAPRLEAAGALRGEIEHLRAKDAELERSLDAGRAAMSADTLTQHEQLRIAGEQTVLALQLDGQLVSVNGELTPILQAVDMTIEDLARDTSSVARRLAAVGEELTRLRSRALERQGEERRLAGELEVVGAQTEAARSAAATASQEALNRTQTLEERRRQRAILLAGEATQAHRQRLSAQLTAARAHFDAASQTMREVEARRAAAKGRAEMAARSLSACVIEHEQCASALAVAIEAAGLDRASVADLLAVAPEAVAGLSESVMRLDRVMADARRDALLRARDLDVLKIAGEARCDIGAETEQAATIEREMATLHERLGEIRHAMQRDEDAQVKVRALGEEIAQASREAEAWTLVNAAVGSADGKRFRVIAQGVTLDQLVALANRELKSLAPRYRLRRGAGSDLAVHVIDRDMGEEERTARSLSGGERFLVSLALALALSGLEGRQSFVDTLFIDEGFGTLDGQTLDMVIDALERLQGSGRKVGVITHVAAMVERIAVQVRVEARGNGRSVVRVVGLGQGGAGGEMPAAAV